MDGNLLNEVIIPTTNVDRLLPDGTRNADEVVNKGQTYITTAGWKNTFAYEKLIDILINSLLDPAHYCIMGGTYQTPVKEGLLDEDFVEKLKLEGEQIVSALKTFTSHRWGIIILKIMLTGKPKLI